MSKTKVVCPNCGAEFAIPEKSYVTTGMVIGADSNLGTISPMLAGQSTTKPDIKAMGADAKIEALRKAGVNVDNLFSLKNVTGKDILGRMENGSLVTVSDDDPIFKVIMDGGTIESPQLYRRWVMAQMFHMLATGDFIKALQNKGYKYQWKMLADEFKAQARMAQNGDTENFEQRNLYFNKTRAYQMAQDYIDDLRKHIELLPKKRCKGVKYISLKGGDYFVEDIPTKITKPLTKASYQILTAKKPQDLYAAVVAFQTLVNRFWNSRNVKMSPVFKDSYKGAGAYFTMRNMILYHNAKFRNNKGRFLSQENSLKHLEDKAQEYKSEGWRLFGVMKKLISDSGMDIKKKMAEWRR